MANRLQTVFSHLISHPQAQESDLIKPQNTSASSLPQWPNKPDDIVIIAARRTPIGKAKRGSFKDTLNDDLLAAVFSAVIKDGKIKPEEVDDICVGCVLDKQSATTARLAQFYSGIPEETAVYTTNRQCASGLQAVMNVAGNIKNGAYKIGLAAGVENMTKQYGKAGSDYELNPRAGEQQVTMDVLLPMGVTSENVAERYGITRKDQDEFSVLSQAKAKKAQDAGLFDAEITPVTTIIKDKEGNEKTITVSKDEGIRPTTMESLGKLRSAFKQDGTSTAGNSSQVSDGAAAVLVSTREEAAKRGLPILGVIRAYAVKGCAPDVMGIGPAVAIPIALEKAGLGINDVEIYEINEAFASQAVYCVKKLGIPIEKVNPKGGAIALGHPLGCTGARQVSTLLHELKRRGPRSCGVISMCMGTGMGAACVIEYPGQA